jgi:hypothetical protein
VYASLIDLRLWGGSHPEGDGGKFTVPGGNSEAVAPLMGEGDHVEGYRQGVERRRPSLCTRRVASVDDPFETWSKWLVVFIEQFDDNGDISQCLVVLDLKDEDQRHGRMGGWDGANVDHVPAAAVNEELPALDSSGISEHCCRGLHVTQCNT